MSEILDKAKAAYKKHQDKIEDGFDKMFTLIISEAGRGDKKSYVHWSSIEQFTTVSTAIERLTKLGFSVALDAINRCIEVCGWDAQEPQDTAGENKPIIVPGNVYKADQNDLDGIDYLRSAVKYFNNCTESLLQDRSIVELLNIYAAYWESEFDYTIQHWSPKQLEAAAKNATPPVFDMDGNSV